MRESMQSAERSTDARLERLGLDLRILEKERDEDRDDFATAIQVSGNDAASLRSLFSAGWVPDMALE